MSTPIVETLLGQVDTSGDCWIWKGPVNHGGYGKFGREIDGKSDWGAHRASYRLLVGPIENELLVCHTCNNPRCVKPSHLYLDTPLGNVQYAVRGSRMKGGVGIKNGSAKLNDEKVISIRKMHREGKLSCRRIGEIFGVTGGTIYDISKGKIWKHVMENK